MLEAIHFRRIAEGGDAAALVWEVEVRQLIMATAGAKVLLERPEGCIKHHYQVIQHPRRRFVVSQVARVLHYPNDLLNLKKTPIGWVIEYLRYRRRLKLVATYGRFRNKRH